MNLLFPKVPSGIPGLDKMIGGGFTKNSVITVSGSTGSGRTTFATQFLVNGFRENGEPGIYLSFNEPKYSIFANMSAFDWNLPELERNKQVVFIEYPSSELNSFMEQEGSLLELVDTLGVERVVFDSITPLAMLSSDGDERQRSIQKLVNVIRKWGVTTLITASDVTPPDPDLPRTSVGIEAMTDGFIHLGWMREGNRRLRTLEVVKMRGSAHAHLIHLTTIDENGYRLVDAEIPEKEVKPKPKLGAGGTRTGSIFSAGREIAETGAAGGVPHAKAVGPHAAAGLGSQGAAAPKAKQTPASAGQTADSPFASKHGISTPSIYSKHTSTPSGLSRPAASSYSKPSVSSYKTPASSVHLPEAKGGPAFSLSKRAFVGETPKSGVTTSAVAGHPLTPPTRPPSALGRPPLSTPSQHISSPTMPILPSRPTIPHYGQSRPDDDDDKDVRVSHRPILPLFGAPPKAPPLPKAPAKKPPRDENE